mmetsp:Transcript_19442/g.41901  ORF Transcript_19442/g.41901 Transcript_19442/m.41901 type:complete len:216 (+) Transcript_19442:784-1431(+)
MLNLKHLVDKVDGCHGEMLRTSIPLQDGGDGALSLALRDFQLVEAPVMRCGFLHREEAEEECEERHAARPDVGAEAVAKARAKHLWRTVGGRATAVLERDMDDRAVGSALKLMCEAKINNAQLFHVLAKHDVLELEVPVENTDPMAVCHALHELREEAARLGLCQRASAFDHLVELTALTQFEEDDILVFTLPSSKHLADVLTSCSALLHDLDLP